MYSFSDICFISNLEGQIINPVIRVQIPPLQLWSVNGVNYMDVFLKNLRIKDHKTTEMSKKKTPIWFINVLNWGNPPPIMPILATQGTTSSAKWLSFHRPLKLSRKPFNKGWQIHGGLANDVYILKNVLFMLVAWFSKPSFMPISKMQGCCIMVLLSWPAATNPLFYLAHIHPNWQGKREIHKLLTFRCVIILANNDFSSLWTILFFDS